MSNGAFDLKEIINSLSTALDFTYSGLSGHHKRVTYMAMSMAKKMGLSRDVAKNLYISSIIHDIGAISMQEKELLGELEVADPYTHSELGCRMVSDISFLKPVSKIIKYHHHAWKGNNPDGLRGSEIPLESRIINTVDRLDVILSPEVCLLQQSDSTLNRMKEITGKIIDPDIFAELTDLAARESFWLDLNSQFLPRQIDILLADLDIYVNSEMITDISMLFSRVIDYKSRFTHKHSRRVAAIAGKLARIWGFSMQDSEQIMVAGLLHDIGKLSVPEEILEKPGKLSPDEYTIIKRHTYYTHRILEGITGFSEINRWASFHHERLDGNGYPFRLSDTDIPPGSRILAVSDVFTALAEDRPYRKGMPRERITEILEDLSGHALDRRMVELLINNYDLFESILKHDDPLIPGH